MDLERDIETLRLALGRSGSRYHSRIGAAKNVAADKVVSKLVAKGSAWISRCSQDAGGVLGQAGEAGQGDRPAAEASVDTGCVVLKELIPS